MCSRMEINGFQPDDRCLDAAVEPRRIKRIVCEEEQGTVGKILFSDCNNTIICVVPELGWRMDGSFLCLPKVVAPIYLKKPVKCIICWCLIDINQSVIYSVGNNALHVTRVT